MKPKRPASASGGNPTASAARLLETAQTNPFWQFEFAELAVMLNHTEWLLRQMNKEPDSPFHSGKSRPERICRWLETHAGWMPSKPR